MNIAVCSVLRSCSFMGIMLLDIGVLGHVLALRGFRPNFGRWAVVVVSGNTAGTQFRQCTTSILGAPLWKVPV